MQHGDITLTKSFVRKKKRRIRDQVLTMYQNDRIEKSEAALFIRPESSPMKREGFWRDVTPPLNIYGVPLFRLP